jgi:hypothetical protein
MRPLVGIGVVTLTLATSGCAGSVAPPASPPSESFEDVEPPAPAQSGFGRVAIASDVSARVERLDPIEGPRSGTLLTLLCEQTPCEVTLPYGDYRLRFTAAHHPDRASTALLTVHDPSLILRHELGRERSASRVGPVLIGLGAAALVASAVTFFVSQSAPANPSNGPSGPSPDANDPAPYIALGGFAVLAVGAIVTAVASSDHSGGASGATSVSPRVAAEGPQSQSIGFRF